MYDALSFSRSALISDPQSPLIAPIRALQRREERERTGLFFLDGIRFLSEASQTNTSLELVVVAPKLLLGNHARSLARGLKQRNIPCIQVTSDVYRSLSRAEEPQGLGAVAHQQWQALAQIKPTRGLCWMAFDCVQSPGNLGTILRTAEAVGAAGLICLGNSVDPYDPAAVRATMGALFSQQIVRTTFTEFEQWKRRTRSILVGTSPNAGKDYRTLNYSKPMVLWMGSERKGLSDEQQGFCDIMVQIPMVGRSDSLNVAVAASVMLYEVFNQRHRIKKAS